MMRTLLRAGLLTAASDFAFATVLTVVFYNVTFMRLWQGVAAVPLGREALDGGARTMWIGLGLHVGVAFWWSGVFLFGLMRARGVRRMLLSRFGAIKVAVWYGPLVWLVMSGVVIPLFTKRPPSFTLRWWIQCVGHVPFVALPMTWNARRAAARDAKGSAMTAWLVAALLFLVPVPAAAAEGEPARRAPVEHVYAERQGTTLKAYVVSPDTPGPAKRPAIVLFHGGGWAMGEAAWAFPRAQRFAERGVVAVAAQYRLSDQKGVTPHEAMADARDVIRWIRAHAEPLGVDPNRVAAYGWSAGGHLAASAAIFDGGDSGGGVSARPDALVLVSPAVALVNDGWVQRLLMGRGSARDISPDEHVGRGLPPTLILQGDVDTVTPLAGARRFCERMRAAGNECELHVYEGFGHLFTPAGTRDDGMPQPDEATSADAAQRAELFLESLGFLAGAPATRDPSRVPNPSVSPAIDALLTLAATDFHTHRPPHPIRFRDVRGGYLTTPEGTRQHRLCGEFLAVAEGGKAKWTPFATIQTAPYEQWLGASAMGFCERSSMTWDEGDLSALLQERLKSLE